ncbi:unnamed protein product [Parajaminaea phylloscopi]
MVALAPSLLQLLAFFVLAVQYGNAAPRPQQGAASESAPLMGRAPALVTPAGYTAPWSVTGKRLKIGNNVADWISTTTFTSSAIAQTNVDACTAKCTASSTCVTATLVQYSGGVGMNVACVLYSAPKAASQATFLTRTDGTGKVVVSRAYAKTARPPTTTTTPPTTAPTTPPTPVAQAGISPDGPLAKNRYPTPPQGATLYQFRPSQCSGSKAYVPIFANDHWVNSTKKASTATRAYIVQHGQGRNFDDAFRTLSPNIDQSSALILAPNFYAQSDTPTISLGRQSNYYDPSFNLAWYDTNAWFGGSDAVGPPASAGQCSTYDVWDSLIAKLNDKTAFPALRTIYLVGHSAGAAFVSHYSPVAQFSSSVPVKWVAFNSPSFPYFNDRRPLSFANCSAAYNLWPYGWQGPLPRYVAAAGGSNPTALFKKYVQRDMSIGEGTNDIRRLYDFGDSSCPVMAQGGLNRRERGYAWWAYVNLLAGTKTNVTAYFGATNLTASGLTPVGNDGFNMRHCTVFNVGHVDSDMYGSPCGRSFLGQSSSAPPNQAPILVPV